MQTTTNGQYHSPPPPVRASSFRPIEVWLKPKFAEGAEYPDDWRFLFWKNHPLRLRRKLLGKGDEEEETDKYEVFTQLVPQHNGWTWTDRAGEEHPYPEPTDREFWDQIGVDLLLAMMDAMTEEIDRLPNLLTRKLETSPSTSSSATSAATRRGTRSRGRSPARA